MLEGKYRMYVSSNKSMDVSSVLCASHPLTFACVHFHVDFCGSHYTCLHMLSYFTALANQFSGFSSICLFVSESLFQNIVWREGGCGYKLVLLCICPEANR